MPRGISRIRVSIASGIVAYSAAVADLPLSLAAPYDDASSARSTSRARSGGRSRRSGRSAGGTLRSTAEDRPKSPS